MGAADVGSWDTKDLSARARARSRDSPHSGNSLSPSPRPRPRTYTHTPPSPRATASCQPHRLLETRSRPRLRAGTCQQWEDGAWTRKALLDPNRGGTGCSSQACPSERYAHRSSELWFTWARSWLLSGGGAEGFWLTGCTLRSWPSETFVLFPTQRVNALALGTPKTWTCHRIKPVKGKATVASPDHGRKRWAWRILSLRVHLSSVLNVFLRVRACACSRTCELGACAQTQEHGARPKQSQIFAPRNSSGDSLWLYLLPRQARQAPGANGLLKSSASAFTTSPLSRPPPAQDPTWVRAVPAGRLESRGPARRLHGIRSAGPLLRKSCLAGQALVGKEGEPVAFQTLKKKQ